MEIKSEVIDPKKCQEIILKSRNLIYACDENSRKQKEKLRGDNLNQDIRVSAFLKFKAPIINFGVSTEDLSKFLSNLKYIKYSILGTSLDPKESLSNYFRLNRFDYFVRIFSVFEDAITSILKGVLLEEYEELRNWTSKILNNEKIEKFILENLNEEIKKKYNDLKNEKDFVSIFRKAEKLENERIIDDADKA